VIPLADIRILNTSYRMLLRGSPLCDGRNGVPASPDDEDEKADLVLVVIKRRC